MTSLSYVLTSGTQPLGNMPEARPMLGFYGVRFGTVPTTYTERVNEVVRV